MKKGLVMADAGPIFSLAIINHLSLLDDLFDNIKIPQAVWTEITLNKKTAYYNSINNYFNSKVTSIKSFNELTFIMDFGESEALILYKELDADFLLIDDKKARSIAENLGAICIDTLGILSIAKEKGLIKELLPLFINLIDKNRYYSLDLLNNLLTKYNEPKI